MTRPALIRKIYVELQGSAGDVASSREMLEAANAIADALSPAERADQGPANYLGGVLFERWSLDRAMADGGWRILRYETEMRELVFEDEIDSISSQNSVKEWMMVHAA